MAQRLTDLPTVVVMWTQHGCPHCDSTLPLWRQVAARYAQCVPSARLSVEEYANAADTYRITMLPTIMTLRWGRSGLRRLEGASTLAEIEAFYQGSLLGLDASACEIQR